MIASRASLPNCSNGASRLLHAVVRRLPCPLAGEVMMRKLLGAAVVALLLITPTIGYAEEAVLGENESSPLVTQVRARAELLRDWDEYLAEIRARDELI